MKNKCLYGIILILIIALVICIIKTQNRLYITDQSIIESEEYSFTHSEDILSSQSFEGCIRDGETAAKIANAVFESVYSDYGEKYLPLSVAFDKNSQHWYVKSNLKISGFGGDAYIILDGKTGAVIYITHEK